ncbi:MAG: chorismate synthase [Bacteroidales bacterium]|jgi:chorismate synthase|nr:chorismate synthase [Bacteroidales bacterium]
MSGNTIGKLFTLTSFGESHSSYIGGVINGCPSGLFLDMEFINKEIERRKPQRDTPEATSRREEDCVEFVSGTQNNITLGLPIAFIIKNKDIKKEDYSEIKDKFRPSHGDYTYFKKYGVNAYSGGGRSSARETAIRVIGGAIAKLILMKRGIEVVGSIESIGGLDYLTQQEEIKRELEVINNSGDSLGGVIRCKVKGCPSGIGEPVFDKLSADLAKSVMSIPSVKGVEIGDGFAGARLRGSEQIDNWTKDFSTATNHSGGIMGGISNGMDIDIRVAFRPVATLSRGIDCIDREGNITKVNIAGRHDRCVLPRAVVIVEAMVAITLTDHLLRSLSNNLESII